MWRGRRLSSLRCRTLSASAGTTCRCCSGSLIEQPTFARLRSEARAACFTRERRIAPGRSRTCDPRFRKPMLYPAELRAHGKAAHFNVSQPTTPMTHAPSMLQAHVRRQLVEEELSKLREVPHSMWRDVIGRPMRKSARARDNRAYSLRTV